MKKVAVLLFSIIIAIGCSFTAFAASSPVGPQIPDKYDVVGTVAKDDKAYTGVTITIDGSDSSVTDKNGVVRFDDLTEGKHTLKFSKGTELSDQVVVNIIKGDDTKSVKLDDGSYNITVASKVSTIYINFDVDKDGNVEITSASSKQNDSTLSPPTGDIAVSLVTFGLILSLVGLMATSLLKKKYCK